MGISPGNLYLTEFVMQSNWKKYLIAIIIGILSFACMHFAFSASSKTPVQPAATSDTTMDTQSTMPITENQVDRLKSTIDIIQQNYIKKVDESTLMTDAISGMITRLD